MSQDTVEESAAKRLKREDETTASSKKPKAMKSQRAERAVSDLYSLD